MNTKLNDWQELLALVENHQGVHRVSIETLREIEGRKRVGKHILSTIEDKLTSLGLGHLPETLPNRQQQQVVLYRLGTPASEVIHAVREGLTQPTSDSAFEALHRLNASPDPAKVVSKEEVNEAVQDATRAVLDLLRLSQNGESETPKLIQELTSASR